MTYVVFIPGIMGSKLKINDAEKWPVLFPNPMKELMLDKNPGILDSEPLLEYGVKRFYKGINDWLYSNYEKSYEFFNYDWRHNLLTIDTFDRLKEHIEDKEDVVLVAHSMGGLFSYLFSRWAEDNHPEVLKKIKKVITIATPWRGSPDALWKLYYGEAHPAPLIPLTSASVMKEVASTFPSVYQLLPHENEIFKNNLVYDPMLEKYLYPIEIFKRLFNPKQLDIYKKVSKNFQTLVNSKWPGGIKPYAIIGQGHATPNTIVTPVNDEVGKYFEKEKIIMAAGDLTVPVMYGIPYDENTECRYIKATHTGIVKNETVLAYVSAIIDGDTEAYYEDFEHKPSPVFTGQVLKVACPVKVSIYKEGNKFIAGEASSVEELQEQLKFISEFKESSKETAIDLYEEMKVFGETTYVISEEPLDLDYKIEGKGSGLASVEIVKYTDGNVSEINVFPSIEVREGEISTLSVVDKDKYTLKVNNKDGLIPKAFTPESIRQNVKPVTSVTYKLQSGKQISTNKSIIIQSKIDFFFDVTGITDEEFLETRIHVNDKRIVTTENSAEITPDPGPNEIVIYSVTKYGIIDEKPVKFNFIYDVEPPKTTYSVLLFPDSIQLYLKAEDDSKVEVTTKYRVNDEKEFVKGISIVDQYTGKRIEYFSIDQLGNAEGSNYLKLPNAEFKFLAFTKKFETYDELVKELNLDPKDIVFISRNGREVNVENAPKIRKGTTNIAITLKNGCVYTIVLDQEIDVLWLEHPTEMLKADDNQLKRFSFRIVSNKGFIQGENVSVKLVPKGTKSSLQLEVFFDKDTSEYFGKFGVPVIPRSAVEGKIQIYIKNKIYRESKFKVMF